MTEVRAVLDTSVLLWYVKGAKKALGRRAARIILEADAGRVRLAVPSVSLFEVALLEERGRLTLGAQYEEWCDLVEAAPGLILVPLERAHVSEARALPSLVDPFDRIIAGTAIAMGVPLLTPDARIALMPRVRVIW